MSFGTRAIVFVVLTAAAWAAEQHFLSTVAPQSAADSVAQLNGGEAARARLAASEAVKNWAAAGAGAFTLVVGLLCFGTYRGRPRIVYIDRRAVAPLAAVGLTLALSGGCMKSYDKPQYEDVDTAETAFLVPLEGDGGEQAKFISEKYLAEKKVATKRVQITHRWNQTGRMGNTGDWIANVRLIKVNRSPVTRLWSADAATGTAAKNESVWVESADSVGFSVGFNCTAFISEEDAAKFLYWYPSGSLAQVMDTEIHGRIQKVTADECGKYDMFIVRSKKGEITKAIDADLIPFFKERGITITAIGMYGGFHYENPKIQEAIDNTAIAAQEKVKAASVLEAQGDINKKVQMEADAKAEAALRVQKAEADGKMLMYKAEADGLREINKALAEANHNPVIVQLKQVEKWDGHFPQWYMGGGAGGGQGGGMPTLMLSVPAPERHE